MLLLIDIGNTHTVLCLAEGDTLLPPWRLASDPSQTPEEIASSVKALFSDHAQDLGSIEGIALASVVPPLEENFRAALSSLFSIPIVGVSTGKKLGITLNVDAPEQLGADRIVNALAAFELYGENKRPLIVVDAGTAITFDLVSDGEFLGGAIAPGPATLARALSSKAAQLPDFDPFEDIEPPPAVGKNTRQAMRSGLFLGTLALVEGLIDQIAAECKEKPLVIATGGFSEKLLVHCQRIDRVDPLLTLRGLYFFHELNP